MYRVFVSLTAALPIANDEGEAVYNFRGSVGTGHFLGQLFRTLGQVLNLPPQPTSDVQAPHPPPPTSLPIVHSAPGHQASPQRKRKDKGKSVTKEVSTQTEEEEATRCDVTEKEGPLVVVRGSRPTGAVPKTKVKACVPTTTTAGGGTSPCAVKRSFLPGSSEVKERPLFVCNRGASTPIKTRWKRRPKTQWENTAKTMLDMSVIYLRKLPQSDVQTESQIQVISRLSDHTLEAEVLSQLLAQLQMDNDDDEDSQKHQELSKATIRWTCSMALHLLAHSRINNTTIKKKQITLPKKL